MEDGDRPMWQPTTSAYDMDRVGCEEDDRGHNTICKKMREIIDHIIISKYRRAHCNDFAVYGIHNPHVC